MYLQSSYNINQLYKQERLIQMSMPPNMINQILANLEAQLNQPYTLSLQEFSEQASMLTFSGAENEIAAYLLRYSHLYQGQRSAVKYIYVADKLMKIPSFNEPIANVIVDVFSVIFLSLWNNRYYSEIDQLKILRKYWVAVLHPSLLAQMHSNILYWTGIDIEYGFRPESVAAISQFYQNKLCMRPQEIAFYLPKVGQPQQTLIQNFRPKNHYIQAPPLKQRKQNPNEQETSSYNNKLQLLGQPRKKVHKERKYIEPVKTSQQICREILLKIYSPENDYICRFCGKILSNEKNYQNHLEQHITEKTKSIGKDNRRNKENKLQWNVSEWQSIDNSNSNLYFVSLQSLEQPQNYCTLCRGDIIKDFINDQWVYLNAVKVKDSNKIKLVHKSCQQLFSSDN